ncbi:MAG TPA: DUF6476 family protein, partial [Xanthobacteraceae bacterium]|nr:DUF6476 family protein [Xanthobacteraceae bacterium]
MSKKDEELTPEQAQLVARVRRLMALPLLVMVAGFLTVFGVIAYRIYFKTPHQSPPIERVMNLPRGARVISATASDGKIAVTVETGGVTEVLLYDQTTMQPTGRFIIKTP